jgi:type IV pilus assembly protein PilN
MIRINLLPHREEKRRRNKNAFYTLLVLFGIVGGVVVLVVGGIFATQIGLQKASNQLIEDENKTLDEKIKEIASLKQDIDGLKARQQAVEDLQGDRNQPVYLLDELVKQTPEGVHFRNFKQEGQRVTMSGFAQSNERISELLRNFSMNSPWLEQPVLGEIRSATIGTGKTAKPVFEFSLNVGIKRPRDKDKPAETDAAPKSGVAGNSAGQTAPPPASPQPSTVFDVNPSAVGRAVENSLAKPRMSGQ